MKYYYGGIEIRDGDFEEVLHMVFQSEKKGVKKAFREFATGFYDGSEFDKDCDMFVTPDGCIYYSEVDYREIPVAEFNVLNKYLPCYKI